MSISPKEKTKLTQLNEEFKKLSKKQETLLQIIAESEVPEMVYNSNAIENSTLSLKDTEKVLLEVELSLHIELREVFEAKNLARIIRYIKTKTEKEDITQEGILLLHKMLMTNIDENIAGRFRKKGEYVRVGFYIAPAPKRVVNMINDALTTYTQSTGVHFVERIAEFHLEFERIRPFVDGNGRIGRAIVNYQLQRFGHPPIIIKNRGKKNYYRAFNAYDNSKNTTIMEKIIYLALLESYNKRLTYLKELHIIPLAEYAKSIGKTVSTINNAAKRQTIPAFREKGVWKIGIE